jgi:hypothetical protein
MACHTSGSNDHAMVPNAARRHAAATGTTMHNPKYTSRLYRGASDSYAGTNSTTHEMTTPTTALTSGPVTCCSHASNVGTSPSAWAATNSSDSATTTTIVRLFMFAPPLQKKAPGEQSPDARAPIERTLFRSPYILRQLGFNARQIEEGFYHSIRGRQPFTTEALAECFAQCEGKDFLVNQKEVLRRLAAYCPAQKLRGMWVMDSVHIHVPRGVHTEEGSFKACVLGVWQDEVVWPLLWVFAPGSENETVVGKHVFAAAEEVLGQGFIRHLLVDRG